MQRYKQTELELEGARKAQISRWTDAPEWLLFQTGQRKLAETFAKAMRGRRKQTKAESDASRGALVVGIRSTDSKSQTHAFLKASLWMYSQGPRHWKEPIKATGKD